MRIAYDTADHGTPVFSPKGPSIHIRDLVGAFSALGHSIRLVTARLGEPGGAMAGEIVMVVAPWNVDDRDVAAADPEARQRIKERRYIKVAAAVEERLLALHAETPFDFVYERNFLWSANGPGTGGRGGTGGDPRPRRR